MSHSKSFFSRPYVRKPFVTLLASLGLVSALPTHASVIDGLSAYGSAQVLSDPPVTDGPYSIIPFTHFTSAYASAYGTLEFGHNRSWAGGSSFGLVSGPYGVLADGLGVFDSMGHFIRTWSVTNDTALAQDYKFTFYIYGGWMFADTHGVTGDGYAAYDLNITWDGNSLFSSAAQINSDGSYTEIGTPLSGAAASGTLYSWTGSTITLSLGVLNPGQSKLLQYDLIAHAVGNYGVDYIDYTFVPWSGGCLYGPPQLMTGLYARAADMKKPVSHMCSWATPAGLTPPLS